MSSVIEEEVVEQDGPGATQRATPAGAGVARSARVRLVERAVEMGTSDVISSPEDLPFDRVSRQRLLVAQVAANTIEHLSETGAWERLEPSLAHHLIAQSRLLVSHVHGLSKARPVRSSEPALLLLRRLERRLEIAAELISDEDEKRARSGPGGLFLGDFTEAETERPERVGEPGKKSTRTGKTEKKPGAATRMWRGKAERLAALRQSRRLMLYVGLGFAVVVGSVGYRLVTTMKARVPHASPPPVNFTQAAYLADVQIFVPAKFTAQLGNDLVVIVDKAWLLTPLARRKTDAAATVVFLGNRNVSKVRFQWDDGIPIAQFENGVATWFDSFPKTPGGPPSPTTR